MFFEILTDAVKDSVEILPFLFIAFCILEIFSHRSEQLKPGLFLRFRYAGPILGALLGCIPQCGIPVLAINLYSGNLITPGTLVAVLVSTSDEALLVLLKAPAGQKIILPLLLIKIIAASAAGYAADLWFEKYFLLPAHISCHHGHDFCEKHGIFLSALKHTLELFTYLLIFTFALNLLLHTFGLKTLTHLVLGDSILQPFFTALIGFIPNCAAAVLLSELYLDNIISFAALTAGLCTSSGIGLLVLFRTKMPKKELFKILLFLYLTAVITGFTVQFFL